MLTGQCRYSGLKHGQVNGYHIPYFHVRVVLIRQIINQVANKDNSGT
jgi:hypothetical protein